MPFVAVTRLLSRFTSGNFHRLTVRTSQWHFRQKQATGTSDDDKPNRWPNLNRWFFVSNFEASSKNFKGQLDRQKVERCLRYN